MEEDENEKWHEHHTAPALRELLGHANMIAMWLGLIDYLSSGPTGRALAQLAARAARESWSLHRFQIGRVRRLLELVEAATRRLIVVMARDLPALSLGKRRSAPARNARDDERAGMDDRSEQAPHAEAADTPVGQGASVSPDDEDLIVPRFQLHDSQKRFESFFHPERWTPCPDYWNRRPAPELDEIDVSGMIRRFAALAGALADFPGEANRYLKWRAQRLQKRASGQHCSLSPLRPGSFPGMPPASRPRAKWRAEEELADRLDGLARYALNFPRRWSDPAAEIAKPPI